MHGAPAIGQLITHDLRNGQGGERRFEGFLQAFGQGGAANQTVVVQDVGLAVMLTA